MQFKIFYSWQSDLPNNTNRGFIEKALQNAAKSIRNDDSIMIEPVIDRDTAGFTGSPQIPETILKKIDEAEIFVCDISIINGGSKRFRKTPNPNVLFELGYALKRFSWNKVIMVINTAFGDINKLPFDLEKRRVIAYQVTPDTEDKPTERIKLENQLESAIRAIIPTNKTEFNLSDVKVEKTKPYFADIQNLAKKIQYETFRKKWLNSQQASEDVFRSVNDIFANIDESFEVNLDVLKQSGMKLSKENLLRSIQTDRYGTQIELKNYINNSFNAITNLELFFVLYKKNPMPQNRSLFTTESISQTYFVPDIDEDTQVIWRDKSGSKPHTADELAEKCFTTLVNKINNKGKLDETVEGGEFLVGGRLVNAWGEPI